METKRNWRVATKEEFDLTERKYHQIIARNGDEWDFSITGVIDIDTARLIAAAPDLLEALEEALPGIEELNGEFQEGWESTIELITKAISKAKGI